MVFFGYAGIFIIFSVILIIIKFIEYKTLKIFPGHWAFSFFISLTLINRFVNFGIYFSDSYKLFISLSIIFFIYQLMYSIDKIVLQKRKKI